MIDASGIDEILKSRVERHFRLEVGFGPRQLRRARPRKTVDANVENLRRCGAEASIEHEVEVRPAAARRAARLSTPTSAKPGSSVERFVPSTNLLSIIVVRKPRSSPHTAALRAFLRPIQPGLVRT
ncbi:hypothetical protein [Bradyrhizobium sp. SZCCHNRI2014]|uniref:hypothetical protein n=1 Tax=Bradyrhizobium sp. SZCCHNRI2014 TaxID=3057285 RepID=UPI002916D6FF|nr:hypothetical protein [Bradyrhizobium sp. SZCCHNRI2014]